MKRLSSLLLVLLLLAALPLSALALVEKSESFYVCDDANVLSDELERDIVSLNGELEELCQGAQIVVVSVAYTDGLYADEYAYALMNSWEVGDGENSNGMLLLFATRENRAWLAVGGGIFESFDEDMASLYLDRYFWDDYDRAQYESAVEELVSALANWYANAYGVTLSSPLVGVTASLNVNSSGVEQTPLWDRDESVLFNLVTISLAFFVLFSPYFLFSLLWNRVRWKHWGIWPFCVFRPWWRMRRVLYRDPRYHAPPVNPTSPLYHTRPDSSQSRSNNYGSSYGGSGRSGSSRGGGSSRSSGGGMGRGGGGRSGGGAGRR